MRLCSTRSFDIMGHIMLASMKRAQQALAALTLERDGVDGASIVVYGEAWDFGEVACNQRGRNASQLNIGGTGLGVRPRGRLNESCYVVVSGFQTLPSSIRSGRFADLNSKGDVHHSRLSHFARPCEARRRALSCAARHAGAFNDRVRDAALGGSPFAPPGLQGFLTGLHVDPNTHCPAEAGAKSTLLAYGDLLKLGMAGNLKDFSFETADGTKTTGRRLLFNGVPAGYCAQPSENVVYLGCHDNETLYDTVVLKANHGGSAGVCARIVQMALGVIAVSQGVAFFHAGDDLLRSKSLDRDSYNSGDWFNKLLWDGSHNNFGVGLPPASKNADTWPLKRSLLQQAGLVATPELIAETRAFLQAVLRLRYSTRHFRLPNAEAIAKQACPLPGTDMRQWDAAIACGARVLFSCTCRRPGRAACKVTYMQAFERSTVMDVQVSFENCGPDQVPGVLVMRIGDAAVPPAGSAQGGGVLVAINAQPESVAVPYPAGVQSLRVHPTLKDLPHVAGVHSDDDAKVVSLPGRTFCVLSAAE